MYSHVINSLFVSVTRVLVATVQSRSIESVIPLYPAPISFDVVVLYYEQSAMSTVSLYM